LIAIVDYQAGNLRSVERACAALCIEGRVTADPEEVLRAERVIFPGVGAAPAAMAALRARGLDRALRSAVASGTPVLGICLGAQIVLERSEEGDVECLGLVPGVTRRFRPSDPRIKVPHMGWNEVTVTRPHPLLAKLEPGEHVYFVHSYFPDPSDEANVFARSDHGGPFCCALGKGSLFAVQFHPEKSGEVGLRILEAFASWDGRPC
jgi:imidazole glycerol-phosphate synthase subunit HisH